MNSSLRKLALIIGVSYAALTAALADGRAVLPPQDMVQEYLHGKPSFVTRDDIQRAMIPGFMPLTGFMAGGGSASPPVFIAATTGQTGVSGSNNAPITKPAGTLDGHLMVLCLTSATGSTLPTSGVTGWTLVQADVADTTFTGSHYSVYVRVASSEPSSYTIGYSTTKNVSVCMLTYSSLAPGFDAIGSLGAAGSSSACVAPSLTAAVPGTLIGVWYSNYYSGGAGLTTPPAGMTARVAFASYNVNNSIYVFDQPSPAGASGSRSCLLTSPPLGTVGFLLQIN
jgi:hypothetical protein